MSVFDDSSPSDVAESALSIAPPPLLESRPAPVDFNALSNRESELGQRMQNNPVPRARQIFSLSDETKTRLFNALLGAAAAAQAQGAPGTENSLAAQAAIGFGAGVRAPAAYAAQQGQLNLERVMGTPIEMISPEMVRQFPALAGLPTGVVHQLAPILLQHDNMARTLQMLMFKQQLGERTAAFKNSLTDEDRLVTEPEKQQLIAQYGAYGITQEKLKGIRVSMLPYILPRPVLNPITGETMFAAPKTQFVSPPGAAQASETVVKADTYINNLTRLKNILDNIPAGRVSGRGVDYVNRLTGLFPEAQGARGLFNVLIPSTAKFIGGDVGNLSGPEQERAAEALPKLSGTHEERQQAVSILLEIAGAMRAREAARLSIGGMRPGAANLGPAPGNPSNGMDFGELQRRAKAELERRRALRGTR